MHQQIAQVVHLDHILVIMTVFQVVLKTVILALMPLLVLNVILDIQFTLKIRNLYAHHAQLLVVLVLKVNRLLVYHVALDFIY